MKFKSAFTILILLATLCSWSIQECLALGGPEDAMMQIMKVQAPELQGGYGWLNTPGPIHLKDLRGKVVLLDFWTFCCINCMHVIPDLKKLEAKYPHELVVIGVHSAKFSNEKDSNNIKEAILRYGIEHPVVNDSDFAIWHAYGVNSWPTLVLIDPDGNIVGTASGEGNYNSLDSAISKTIATFDRQGKLNRQPLKLSLEKNKVQDQALSFPSKLTVDASGKRLFISDSGHNRIVVTDLDGNLEQVIGSGKAGADNLDLWHSTFNHPQGLAYKDNVLYVADTENHLIRRIDLKKRRVYTAAGTGKQGLARSGGKALDTALSSPWDLTLVGDKLYIAMAGLHQLWSLDLKTDLVEPYAGSSREDIIDGNLKSASLAQPSGITSAGDKLYFADSEVSAVRSADLTANGKVHSIIGEGLFEFGDIDGNYKSARLQHPLGILYHDGKLYVADSYNHKIKIVDPETRSVTTFLGDGKPGLQDGARAEFSEPSGLAAIGNKLYIADSNNNLVRIADLTTKEVHVLNINRLTPPSPTEMAKTSPAGHTAIPPNNESPSTNSLPVKAGSKGTILFDIKLPNGYHLNPEANIDYHVSVKSGDAIAIDSSSASNSVKPSAVPIRIPFTASKSEGGTADLEIEATVYYCTDDQGICKIKTLQFHQMLHTASTGAGTEVKISRQILD